MSRVPMPDPLDISALEHVDRAVELDRDRVSLRGEVDDLALVTEEGTLQDQPVTGAE